MNNFAKRIKELREEKKITQKELAKIINVSENQISNIEKGLNETRLNKAIKLAEYFNVSIEYLVGISNERKNINGNGTTVLPGGSPPNDNQKK